MSTSTELISKNWSKLLIQRLYHLAKSDEYCDYTIHSMSNDSFKVHRIILNACSDYFCSRPNTDASITIPANLDFNAVKNVIMFMYTGKLNYTEESHINLLKVANMFHMTVVLKLLARQPNKKKSTFKNNSPLVSTSTTCSGKTLHKYRCAKKLVSGKLHFGSSVPLTASTFINTMKVKDVLTENKPMRFECNANSVPEFIENNFEIPKYDSAPLLKRDNVDNAKVMLKRTSDRKLIDPNHETPFIKCDTQTILHSDKKLKIITDEEQKNDKSKQVQEAFMKSSDLLQNKNNLNLTNADQKQFENIIMNTPNSVENLLSVGGDIQKPFIIHKVRPNIKNVKCPWSCNLCGSDANPLPLESYYAFRRHMSKKHNILLPVGFKLLKCDHCEFIASTDRQLNQHKTMLCYNKPCNLCSRTFKTHNKFMEHLTIFHQIDEAVTEKISLFTKNSVQLETKVFLENKSLNEIGEVVSNNYEDFLKQTEYQKDQISYSEEVTEIEIVTIEDALQAINENTS